MKKKLKLLLLLSIIVSINYYYNPLFTQKKGREFSVSTLRKKHSNYLQNSPFKKTLKLSKSERKAIQLPPNKYYEREWELTMNPATGKPEPHKVFEIQKKRNKNPYFKNLSSKTPGDGSIGNDWSDRGPNNVGGRTRVILFDPNDLTNKRVFAGGVSGGLWINNDITDSNSTWAQVSGVPSNMNISCITVDPRNSLIWYIGTGEQYTYGAAVGNGVYKTTDGGTNWIQISVQVSGGGTSNVPKGAYFINDILAWDNGILTEVFIGVGTHIYGDASNPTNWLGFFNSGLYKTSNGGTSWNRIEPPNMPKGTYNYIPNDFEVDSNNTIWMGTIKTQGTNMGGGKIFKSVDGISWVEVVTLPNSNRVELAITSTANKLYALTEGTTSDGPHIFSTNNGFSSYSEVSKPNDADDGITANDFTRGQAFYDLVIEVDPSNDAIVYVGGIDLFRSSDSGSSWSQISKWANNNNLSSLNCSLVHADQHVFTFKPDNYNQAVIGCDGGVYYASDLSAASSSDVFTAMNTDYNVTQFYYGGYGQNTGNEIIIAGAQDNGSQFVNGASSGLNSSTDIYGGDGAFSTIDKDGDYLIVSYIYNNHHYYNLNPTFNYSGYSIDNGDSEGDFINQAGLDHTLNILYSNGSNGSPTINRYILGSNSAAKTNLSHSLLTSYPTALQVSPFTTDKTILLVGLEDGKLIKVSNANSINNSLICWEEITGSSFVGSISDIEFGETESDIFVTFHNYGVSNIWYSSNGGKSWVDKEGDLQDMPIKSILQNPLAKNEVIIGTELGIWVSKNFNESNPAWSSSYNGMRDVKVVDLDLRTSDNSVLATTFGRGFFTGQFDATTNSTFTISTQNSIVNTCLSLSSAIFNMEYKPLGGYSTNTTFSVSGIPSGASYTLSSNFFSSSNTSFDLTINDINTIAKGEYIITITGIGSSTVSKELLLIVKDDVSTITTVSPTNGLNQIDINNVNLVWNADSEATSYDLEIATDAGFNSIIESINTCNTYYSLTSTLNLNTVYYWRVRGKTNCSTGDYSITQNFITNPETDCTSETISFSNNTSTVINDGAESTSIININSGNSFSVKKVNVSIEITHSYVGDLLISLESPNSEIILFNYNCSDEINIDISFDDNAATNVVCGSSPLSGTYKATNLLSTFINENSVGDWTLKVWDGYSGDTGTLNSWTLDFEYDNCTTQTITNSTFLNNPIIAGASIPYILQQSETEASSSGSQPNEQIYMVTQSPSIGTITLNDINIDLGGTFSQDDINTGNVKYINSSPVNNLDSFIVDITNTTNGFLPNQQVNLTIDASSLSIDYQFFKKTGTTVYPTISNGEFFIASNASLGLTSIDLYSINGQKVFSDRLNINKGVAAKISVFGLSSGVYILKIKTETISGSKKLIIR